MNPKPSFPFRTSLPRLRPPSFPQVVYALTLVCRRLLKKGKHTITFGSPLIFTEMQTTQKIHKIAVCLEQRACLIAPLGILDPQERGVESPGACSGGSSELLHEKKGGNGTQANK